MNCALAGCEKEIRGDAYWIVGPETGHPMFCSYEHLYLYAKEEVEGDG